MPSTASSQAPSAFAQMGSLASDKEDGSKKYDAAKKHLLELLSRKRQIDRNLAELESQIYAFEGSYLSSTANSGGNIIKGFEQYLKPQPAGADSSSRSSKRGGGAANTEVREDDRLFSRSSSTYTKSLALKTGEGRSASPTPDPADTISGNNSSVSKSLASKRRNVSGADTPKGAGGGNNKRRKMDGD